MNSISHKQAREWTQLQLDGQLDEAKTFALTAHLQDCPACRAYALRFKRLDSELRQGYQERIFTEQPVLSLRLSGDSAIHRRMRLKMKSKQIMKDATSFAFIAVAILAFLGFSWLISTRGGMISPGAGNDPLPTLTPTPLPWTETKPLTDGGTILQILHALRQRQIERLSEPGWYVYGRDVPSPDGWMNNYYMLTHTRDRNGACDFMTYYVKDGKNLPQFLALADGRWGMIDVESQKVHMGKAGGIQWNNGSMTDTCTLENVETIGFLESQTDEFEDILNGRLQGTYKAWTEQIDGHKLFVLDHAVTVNGQDNMMDPDTRKLEPIDRTQTWVYFDLDWGTVLYDAGWQVTFLQNGKIIGSRPDINKMLASGYTGYTYYQDLPPDLQEAYEKAVADLTAYLQK